MEWSDDWPTTPGRYWFHGRIFKSDTADDFHYVQVWKAGIGLAFVADGNFMYKADSPKGKWMPVQFPDPPVLD